MYSIQVLYYTERSIGDRCVLILKNSPDQKQTQIRIKDVLKKYNIYELFKCACNAYAIVQSIWKSPSSTKLYFQSCVLYPLFFCPNQNIVFTHRKYTNIFKTHIFSHNQLLKNVIKLNERIKWIMSLLFCELHNHSEEVKPPLFFYYLHLNQTRSIILTLTDSIAYMQHLHCLFLNFFMRRPLLQLLPWPSASQVTFSPSSWYFYQDLNLN